jgi:hypothetical protein
MEYLAGNEVEVLYLGRIVVAASRDFESLDVCFFPTMHLKTNMAQDAFTHVFTGVHLDLDRRLLRTLAGRAQSLYFWQPIKKIVFIVAGTEAAHHAFLCPCT